MPDSYGKPKSAYKKSLSGSMAQVLKGLERTFPLQESTQHKWVVMTSFSELRVSPEKQGEG